MGEFWERSGAFPPKCCGKPKGCTNTDPGCVYLRHPWKRIVAFGESPRPGDPSDLTSWAAGRGRFASPEGESE